MKPRIMVAHDAPSAVIEAVFPDVKTFLPLSRIMQPFDAMFAYHRASAWANSGSVPRGILWS